ncbi:hypothetical protein MLD38_016617 [Melastoma candidum]|uniref:Uncharacterized protein n=1 Tax=Melastoma candidum TaxID=119954 RepID=A0ACB9QNI9_9MYRT|nr:hypothetical protein MLD38_016617 [Melastoma candidum]
MQTVRLTSLSNHPHVLGGSILRKLLEKYLESSILTEAEGARMTEVFDVVNELVASIMATVGHTPGGARIQIWIGEAAVVIAGTPSTVCPDCWSSSPCWVPKRGEGMKTVSGSVAGGNKVTQAMIDFCSEQKIYPTVELIPIDYANEALERLQKRDVKY